MYTIFSYTSYANDLWLSPAADTGMWVVRLVVCCEDGKAATCWSQGTPPSVGPQDQVNSWHPHLGGASQPLPHSFWLVSLRYHVVPLVDCNRKHNQCHAVLFMLLMMNAFIYAILHSWADSLRVVTTFICFPLLSRLTGLLSQWVAVTFYACRADMQHMHSIFCCWYCV